MDVRMPDGTVIKNVPEGTTKSELQRKLDARSAQPQAAPPKRGLNVPLAGPMGLALDLGVTGLRNTAATLYGAATGVEAGYQNYGQNNYKATEAVESGTSLAGEP